MLGCAFMVIFCFGAVAGIVSGFFQRKTVNGTVVVELNPSSISFRKHLINLIIGVVGAFAFVPFGARILDLDFQHIFNQGPLQDTFKCLLFLISLSIIGGFAGYRALASLTDKMLARMNELDLRTKELETANSKLGRANQELDEMAKREAAFDRAMYASIVKDQDIEAATTAIQKSLESYPTKYGEFVNGMVLKRKRKLNEAIQALDRAFLLPPDEFCPTDASLYWNKACYIALLEPTNLADIMGNLDRSIQIKSFYRNDILKEPDLAALLDNPIFVQHFHPTKATMSTQVLEDKSTGGG